MREKRKRSAKRRTSSAVILSIVCIALFLDGCAPDKSGGADASITENNNTADVTGGGQSITDMDIKQSDETDTSDILADKDSESGSADQAAVPDIQEPTASDSKSLYEQFLSGEITVSISSSYPDPDYVDAIIQKEDSYTLAELGQCVSNFFLDPEYTDKTSYDSIQYAYIECPDSAEDDRNLLVRFNGLNIYTQDDDSYEVFVITEENGQLFITHEYQCWARSATIANSNGILNHSGSGGAGDHYGGQSVILANGTNASVYDAEVLYGWWTSYVNDTVYSEVFGAETEPSALIVSIYTIGGDQYYLYDISECTEEDKILCETYITRCKEEQGINWVTEEEIQTAVKNRCGALGIDYGITQQQQEVVWNNF